MTRRPERDPAGLGRGPLGRRLPVWWQAKGTPDTLAPFRIDADDSPRRLLLRVLLSAKRISIPAAACAIVQMIGESALPVIMGLAIDQALATGDARRLVLWLIVIGVTFAVSAIASRFAQQLTAYATQLVQHRLRTTLSRRILHPSRHGAQRIDGGVVSAMTVDVGRLGAIGVGVFPVGEFAAIVFIAVSLLVLSWPLGVAALVGAPIAVWLMGLLSGRLARQGGVYQGLLAQTVGRATDLVSGYRVLKGVRAEDEAGRRYRDASRETLDGAWRNVTLLGRFLTASGTVSGVFIAGIAGLAGVLAVSGDLTVGGFIAAVGLAQALLPQMRMLATNAVPAWANSMSSSIRVLDVVRRHASADAPEGDVPAGAAASASDGAVPSLDIELDDGTAVRVRPGEFVGVRADEVSAMAILDALTVPGSRPEVSVRLSGTPADEVSHDAYRSVVVVAPHHAVLFTGTIGENLDVPRATPTRRELALEAAACGDFLPSGAQALDVETGEMGNRLSGGQRQRVALARALATDAPLLVLHDPTTAVDSVTENRIADRIRRLRDGGLSTLVFASSPALLGVCDRVVEVGTHQGGTEEGQ